MALGSRKNLVSGVGLLRLAVIEGNSYISAGASGGNGSGHIIWIITGVVIIDPDISYLDMKYILIF